MKPSEIRAELLAQHAGLRARMAEVRKSVERRRGGEDADLGEPLVELFDAMHAHNAREEQLMRDVFPTLDMWGPVRNEVMLEEHVLEHKKLIDSLSAARDGVDGASLDLVLASLDKLASHMEREEEAFLGEEVLSDDGAEFDFSGG